ncbi:hypothetical protein C8Q80DRAFT_1266757 [Daedaleopsis nitida]|nr:hypothetical protein C8Q80DRAFT_1266757 [Daedaleopsis nitida]
MARHYSLYPRAVGTYDLSHGLELSDIWRERSQSAPISLVLSWSNHHSNRTEHCRKVLREDKMLSGCIPRCRRLYANYSAKPLSKPPDSLIIRPAPQLECLMICAGSIKLYKPSDHPTNYSRYVLFRDNDGGGPMSLSSLKALFISSVSFWLPSNSFPHLTHLSLSFSGVYMDLMMNLFIDLLASASCLQYLWVCDAAERVSLKSDVPRSPVSLSSLRTLQIIKSALPFSLHLLGHLDLPEDTVVGISHIAGPTMNDSESMTAIHHLHPHTHDGVFWMSTTRQYVGDWMVLRGWLDASLPTSMPLSNITTLHIYEGGPVLAYLLPHMPQLIELATRWWWNRPSPWLWVRDTTHHYLSRDTDSISQFLSTHIATCAPASDVPIFYCVVGGLEELPLCCPALRVLSLEVTDAAFLRDHSAPHLARMAAARAQAGCRLPQLSIRIRHRPDGLSDALAPPMDELNLAPVVEHVDVLDCAYWEEEGPVCGFLERLGAWEDPEAERYWDTEAWHNPDHDMPSPGC